MLKLRMDNLTRHGIDAVRNGNTGAGRGLLEQAVKDDSHNALAWHWLASIEPDQTKKQDYLEHVLEIDPKNSFALRDLTELNQHRRLPADTPSVTTFTRPTPAAAQPAAQPEAAQPSAAPPAAGTPPAASKPAGSARDAVTRLSSITGPQRPAAASSLTGALPAAASGLTSALPATAAGASGAQPAAPATPVPPAGRDASGHEASHVRRAASGPTTVSAPPVAAPRPAGVAAGLAAGAAAGLAAGSATAGGDAAPGSGAEAAPGKPCSRLPLAPPLTADDVLGIVRRHRARRHAAASAPPRLLLLAILALLLVGLVAGMLARRAAIARTGAPETSRSEAGAAQTGAPETSAPQAGADTVAARPVTHPVHTGSGDFVIPGTAYLKNPAGASGANGSVVPLSPEPAAGTQPPVCALPQGAAVLLLDSRVAADGRRAFQVQHRECTGWVDEGSLSSTPVGPGPVIQDVRSGWRPGK